MLRKKQLMLLKSWVEEIRRALMQAGQKLGRHIKRESKSGRLRKKKLHILKSLARS